MALCGFGSGFFRGAEQPHDARGGAAGPLGRRRRHAGGYAHQLGMTLGATVVALMFHLVPDRAEALSLTIGTILCDRCRGHPACSGSRVAQAGEARGT